MRPVVRLAGLVAVLVLSACGSPAPAPEAVPMSSAPTVSTPTPRPGPSDGSTSARPSSRTTPTPAVVPETLAFTGTTVDGKPFDGASLAGKPALFWFWAPWCPTCRSQTGEVQAVARDFAGRVAVIGVGSLDDAAAIKAFAADVPGLTHLDDESGAVFRHFAVVQQSSFVLLDADGRKAWSVGYGGSDDLAAQVAAVAG